MGPALKPRKLRREELSPRRAAKRDELTDRGEDLRDV